MFGILSVLVKQWRVTCVLYLPLYLNPLVSAMVSAISINASVCLWTNFTVSSIDVIHVVSWLLCLKANMKRNSKNIAIDPWLFLDGPPQNAQRKPVGKILDKLAIVFEAATAFKAALYSLFNSKSSIFSEVKTHVKASSICLLEGYTLLLSPLPQD